MNFTIPRRQVPVSICLAGIWTEFWLMAMTDFIKSHAKARCLCWVLS